MLVKRFFPKNVQRVMVVRVLELVEHLAFLAVSINLEVTKIQIFSPLIAHGTPKIGGRASKMGAFSSILSDNEIINIVTYLRFVENERISSGEIEKPVVEEKLEFPEN